MENVDQGNSLNMRSAIIREVFPYLKLKDNNLTFLKKMYIYIEIVAQLWVIIWLLLYLGLPLFATNSYRDKNITFYTYEPTDNKKVKSYFVQIASMIQKSPLNIDKQKKIAFYFMNNHAMYAILNPVEFLPNRQTFAVTIGQNIFLNNAHINTNEAYACDGAKDNLDAILVHESIHAMQNAKYGWFYSSFRMPYWVKEGYAIYSAWKLSRYNESKIIEYLKTQKTETNQWSIFLKDQLYALMVKHAIEQMHYSVDDLHRGKVDYDTVYKDMMKYYKDK